MSSVQSVGRYLTVYDGKNESLIEYHELVGYSLATFLEHFFVDPERDPQMFDRYSITPEDAQFVQPFLPQPVDFDFQSRAYFIETLLSE